MSTYLQFGTEDQDLNVTMETLLGANDLQPGETIDPYTISVSEGSITFDGSQFILTPPANFAGEVVLTYTMFDSGGTPIGTTTSTVYFNGVNDAPVSDPAVPELSAVNEDVPYTISSADLLFYYSDVENDQLTLNNLSANHGSVTDNHNGTWTITPDANYNGVMTLAFDVSDGTDTTPGTATYTVKPVEDAPVRGYTPALPDTGNHQGYTLSLSDLLGGFTDGDGDNLSVVNLSVDHGTATFNGQDGWTITFDPGYSGPVTYDYQVTDGQNYVRTSLDQTVTDTNHAPALTSAQASPANATEDESYTVNLADLLEGFGDEDSDSLSVTAISVDHGSIQAGSVDGTWTISPEADYNGPVVISYTVSDGWGGTTDATLNLTVDPVNDAPTGSPSGTITDGLEDLPRKINASTLLTGFSDVDGDTLRVTSLSADHGSFASVPGGGWMFTPEANYSGLVTVTYTVYDGHGATIPNQTRTFTVLAENDAPVRDTTPVLTDATGGQAYTLNLSDLLDGISDVEGDTLSVTQLSADHATVTDNHNGTWTVTPDTTFSGTLTYSYMVDDSHGGTLDTSLTQTVLAGNHAPVRGYTPSLPDVGNRSTYTLNLSDLLGGVTDADSDSLTVTGLTANHATLVDNHNGTWTVTPASGYTGALTYSYTVSDGHGGTLDTSLVQTVLNGNHAPAGAAPSLTSGTEDVTYTVTDSQLLTGFTDADGDTLSVQNVSATYSQGYVGGTPDAGVTGVYNIYGAAALTGGGYVESIRYNSGGWGYVTKVYDSSHALVATVNAMGKVVGLVDGSFVVIDSSSANGTVDMTANHYSATGTQIGSQVNLTSTTDSHEQFADVVALANGGYAVTWQVSPLSGNTYIRYQEFNPNGTTATAAMTVESSSGSQFNSQIARLSDGTLVISWTQPDNSGYGVYQQHFTADGTALDAASLVNTTTASHQHGARMAALAGGGYVISWSDNSSFTRQFQIYDASGAKVGVQTTIPNSTVYWLNNGFYTSDYVGSEVAALPDGGFAVAGIATDGKQFSLSRYDSTGHLLGSQTAIPTDFSNGFSSNINLITLADGSLQAMWNNEGNGNALMNRNFAEGVNGAGTVSYNSATHTYSVARPADSNGLLTLNYEVSDGHGGIKTVSTTTNITAVNDAPRGSWSTVLDAINEDGSITVSRAQLLAGFSDVDSASISIRNNTVTSSSGTVTYNSSAGTWTITPAANYNGSVTLGYTVWDGSANATNAGSLSFTVNAVNDAPALTGAKATITGATEDVGLTLTAAQLKQGYSDVEDDTISISSVSANHGTITDNANGTWSLTPEANYNGTVVISYTLSDGNGGSLVTSLNITVAAVNDAPAGSPSGTVADGTEDTTQTILASSLLAGLSDVDGDTLSVSAISADHGTLTTTSGGWTFTPAANYNGPVTLTYTVSDGHGGTLAGQTRSFNLAAVNDAPTGTPSGTILNSAEDTTQVIAIHSLLDGISDADNEGLVFSSISVDHGSLTPADGGWTYTPPANFNGTVTVTYSVSDTHGGELTNLTRSFTVTPVNDAPAGSPSGTVADGAEDTTQVILAADLLAGFSDADNDTLSVSAISVNHGTLTATTGGWTFTPAANYNGQVTVTYTVSDGHGGTITGQTRSFTLASVNDAPALTGTPAALGGTEDVPFTFTAGQLATGWTDGDGDDIVVSGVSADHGVITQSGVVYTFTPEQDYFGPVLLSFTLGDGQASSPATLGFNLNQVIDTLSRSVTTTLGPWVENLSLTGAANIDGTGNAIDNVIKGNAGNNRLYGLGGNDTLSGYNGNDELNGGAGDDLLRGGAGDDTYYVDSTKDLVREDITRGTDDGGHDLVISSATFTLGVFVEDLALTGTADLTGTGNELDNAITGNDGANRLSGLGGNDVINGGAGNDNMRGGAGDDTYYVDSTKDIAREDTVTGIDDGGHDLVISTASYTLAAFVEDLTLDGTINIKGTGNDLDNIIHGNSGNNTLSGLAGNDVLDGGGGTDRLLGGAGDDTYYIDSGSDVASEETVAGINDGGTDTVISYVSYTLGNFIENLTLAGLATSGAGNALDNLITGNAQANTLFGYDGNDVIDGGLGADNMRGGAGDDTYIVDDSGDIVNEKLAANVDSGGTDLVLASVSYTLSTFVDNLTLTGTANINATGNGLDNVLTGNAGNNVLNGGLGNDRLSGGAGADTFILSKGHDYILDFNASEGDRIDLSSVTHSVVRSSWMSQDGSDVVINLGNGTLITVSNATYNDPNLISHIIW